MSVQYSLSRRPQSPTEVQNPLDLWPGETTAVQVLDRIRRESRDESEKGRWFENLTKRLFQTQPELDVAEVHRWTDWPEREALTGLDGRDRGIDLVVRLHTGQWVAVQCKCYAEHERVGKGQIDSFLAFSQRQPFQLRWIVATCQWTRNAESELEAMDPPVRRLDFMRWADVPIGDEAGQRPIQQPWALQVPAIDHVVHGLQFHDRGRLIMACGTGKTFVSLRIAEKVVGAGGTILFLAPSIALVSQARREWLRHTARPLRCLVVCSDQTAGGRNENDDIGLSELECPVTSSPAEIAVALKSESATRVVFCTYQSLQKVSAAQQAHGAPSFDLTIADEAHRTTGIDRARSRPKDEAVRELFANLDPISNFQVVHDGAALCSQKRLYMTATPRMYTEASKVRHRQEGLVVIDMVDSSVYGPELHRLSFAKAVENSMLSDYRVIVLGVRQDAVTPGLRQQLISLGELQATGKGRPVTVRASDMMRVLGTSLAINGVTEGEGLEKPERLLRTLGFANSIARSRFFAQALALPSVKAATTRRKRAQAGKAERETALDLDCLHLDASDSALTRNRALRALALADREGKARMLCNVRLFAEGVDVPSLDAVAFLEPRDSQVDVVQAVGRVMRRAAGKRFGYIVIPIPIEPGQDIAAALETGSEGYSAVGRVLRALQSHDGRLAEDPLRFVKVYESTPPNGGGDPDPDWQQEALALQEASQGIYAHVVKASGLGKPGLLVSQEIEDVVKQAAATFVAAELEQDLARGLGLVVEEDGGAKGVCTIAALLMANACLLHRRLCDVPHMGGLPDLNSVGGAQDPCGILAGAWNAILKRDYTPVFEPALAAIQNLPTTTSSANAVRSLAECANRVADSLSELGYDHAGPLYHRILGSAKSDGAFYTNNISALLLARLALSEDFVDWSSEEAVGRLRIMDPACGTGTLLLGALQTIKTRVEDHRELDENAKTELHRRLVEDSLCGLDINRHGVQLAACNLTLGAPTVDYGRMNLLTMRHGPQRDGSVAAGSLEMLRVTDQPHSLLQLIQPLRSLEDLRAEQVSDADILDFPLQDLDVVIMNPPFTDNMKRGRKYDQDVVKRMQKHELGIRDEVQIRDYDAGELIDANSISTFFAPLADFLLKENNAVLAKVMPTTAATNSLGLAERRFLADRFHIERIVTTHDPRRINFSENTSIHECLVVCRRLNETNENAPTEFVSLRSMPSSAEQAIKAADEIAAGQGGRWGRVTRRSADRVRAGDWSPVQWYDGSLVEAVLQIEASRLLLPAGTQYEIGPAGRRIRDAFQVSDTKIHGSVPGFHSIKSDLRRTLQGEPEVGYLPKPGKEALARRYAAFRRCLLVANRHDTVSGRLTALWSETAAVGSGWTPMGARNADIEKALAVWWNSTPVRLMLLNRRAKKLNYPAWSMAHLREIRVPTPDNPGWKKLRSAFDQLCREELLPMKQSMEDPARVIIDDAAAKALGVEVAVVADWRERLSREPTITNRAAPE